MTVAKSDWKMMDTAPRKDVAGQPVPITLFLPGFYYDNDDKGHPVGEVMHGECIGHWDAKLSAWVHAASGNAVYPSMWKP